MAEQRLQEQFRKDAPYNVTYNYQDIESGTGMVNFYGTKMVLAGSVITYHLIEETFDTGVYGLNSQFIDDEPVCGFTANPTGTLTFDTDIFNHQRIINGTAYAIIPVGVIDTGTNADITITDVKLIRVNLDASTTTLTNEFDFDLVATTDATSIVNKNLFLKFNSISSQVVKLGEKIRLSLTIAKNGNVYLCHNPSGSSVVVNNSGHTLSKTQMVVSLPFKIR